MLRIFRFIALLEAISTVILFFVAMPVKYILPRFMEVPEDIRLGTVRIAGSIHGFLVVVFVILLLMCWQSFNWKISRVLKYFVVSLIPIFSFWVEIDLKKVIEGEK
ncbi:DUF3817 domain-containing protein [Sphingobacterium rhinopitheci]|uniref:DUF3817 domain-containing protein n=1 Tax=Sphingobacterium rhinopitheci TaxID=2781960 RepID=UPI001F51E176|nr:DUF3817 domain-containing protein [Sphingobacterium rhinopitheci]MCI0920733.1 DUF3817 domain-containing protein [Sphingobacterium rhinopitheci]